MGVWPRKDGDPARGRPRAGSETSRCRRGRGPRSACRQVGQRAAVATGAEGAGDGCAAAAGAAGAAGAVGAAVDTAAQHPEAITGVLTTVQPQPPEHDAQVEHPVTQPQDE